MPNSNPNQKFIQATLDLASVGDIAEGKSWYAVASDAATNLATRYNIAKRDAIGVIAALSPRNKWSRNLIDAENIIAAFVAGGSEAANDIKVCTFGANKAKALLILESNTVTLDDVLTILSGPKLREFASCIAGRNDVCIDGHAYNIWNGQRTSLKNVPSIGVKLRKIIKADYIAVAEKNNLTSYELQAITWVTHRRIHGVA